jgi:DNA-binding MarR family transcriptional regulator
MAPGLFSRRATTSSRRLYAEEFSINALQMAVMNAQRRLPPGHVATALDIAGDLRLRPGPVEQALESLKKLHLVQVAFATSDGYPGYSLTKPGEIFLATCPGWHVPCRGKVPAPRSGNGNSFSTGEPRTGGSS